MRITRGVMAMWLGSTLLLTLALVGCRSGSQPLSQSASPTVPDLAMANQNLPGLSVKIEDHLVPGKVTICEFFSNRCGPCVQMAGIMESLARNRPDLAIRRFDIDRVGQQSIDFGSPLAQQMGLHVVPYFRIYDAQGRLLAQERNARELVKEWYSQSHLIQRGQSDPGTREMMKNYER